MVKLGGTLPKTNSKFAPENRVNPQKEAGSSSSPIHFPGAKLLLNFRGVYDLPFMSNQGTIGCTPNNVSMVFIGFSRDSWG